MVKVKLELPHLMGLAVESMDVIYKNPKSIFTTMRAIDFIDKGYEIDCDQKVLAAKMACKEFKQSKGIRIVDADANLLRHRWFDLVCYLSSDPIVYGRVEMIFFSNRSTTHLPDVIPCCEEVETS